MNFQVKRNRTSVSFADSQTCVLLFRLFEVLFLSVLMQGFTFAYATSEPEPLQRIKERSEETHSDAVFILKDGKVVLDFSSGQHNEPIETMSATKSVVSIAIGLLIDDRYLQSIDTPVWHFYPEWKQGKKEQITVRHLLNHTSGLQANQTTEDINASPDFIQFALAADLSHDPGTHFFYNNKAVNLLSGIVRKASGQRLDRYLDERLFRKLGIENKTEFFKNDVVKTITPFSSPRCPPSLRAELLYLLCPSFEYV